MILASPTRGGAQQTSSCDFTCCDTIPFISCIVLYFCGERTKPPGVVLPEDTDHSLLYHVGATKIVLIDSICWHVKAFTEVYCYGSVNVTKCFSVNN